MTIYTKATIDGTEYFPDIITVDKSLNSFDASSKFKMKFSNYAGSLKDVFSLNDEVIIYADKDSTPATTKIFTGIIESIDFKGSDMNEMISISGRDYSAILQDIIISPRIFKDLETSKIVEALMVQNSNGSGLTYTNLNSTLTTVERITFNNISLYDAIAKLAEIAGYYFYIDVDKDLHFEQNDAIDSGLTFNNTNVLDAEFKNTDSDIFNNVYVYGDRVLTGAAETFAAVSPGSSYTLDDKPHNVRVIGSGTVPTTIQPGGILYINDPADEDVQFLVDFNASQVILTSGTTGGDNLGWTGSVINIEYDRSSPLISIRQDASSITAYGQKDKYIVDRNIKSLAEANLRANTFLAEHKDAVVQGNILVNGVVDVTPGNTCTINIPFHGIDTETYMMINASYVFTTENNLSDNVLKIFVNKRIKDFINYIKEMELRLRTLEGSEVDTSITNILTATGSVSVESSYVAVNRSIGSAFYFHIPGHDKLNSPSSLLGDVRAGSTILSG